MYATSVSKTPRTRTETSPPGLGLSAHDALLLYNRSTPRCRSAPRASVWKSTNSTGIRQGRRFLVPCSLSPLNLHPVDSFTRGEVLGAQHSGRVNATDYAVLRPVPCVSPTSSSADSFMCSDCFCKWVLVGPIFFPTAPVLLLHFSP